jgi:hypothetical protein
MSPNVLIPHCFITPTGQYFAEGRTILRSVYFQSADLQITKEKLKFDKSYDHTFRLRIRDWKPQPVYERSDLRDRPNEGQICKHELVNVKWREKSVFKMNIIIHFWRRGIVERLVLWGGYSIYLDSWMKVTDNEKS